MQVAFSAVLLLLRSYRGAILAAVVAVALIAGGVLALGGDGSNVTAARGKNCPPVARADSARTEGREPVTVDVLANDTDPDGDPMLFNIIETTSGAVKVDQNGTPTDSSDDRLQYTPSEATSGAQTIVYEVEDTNGLSSRGKVTIDVGEPSAAGDPSNIEGADGVEGADTGVATEPAEPAVVVEPASTRLPEHCRLADTDDGDGDETVQAAAPAPVTEEQDAVVEEVVPAETLDAPSRFSSWRRGATASKSAPGGATGTKSNTGSRPSSGGTGSAPSGGSTGGGGTGGGETGGGTGGGGTGDGGTGGGGGSGGGGGGGGGGDTGGGGSGNPDCDSGNWEQCARDYANGQRPPDDDEDEDEDPDSP